MNMPNIVPASIQRVRRFLSVQGGMKVEPWAGVDETLDAFHDLLVSRRHDDGFWKDLELLLATLADDLRRRQETTLIDNEVLDPHRHETLLAEIRSALENRTRGRGGFRKLAAALSVPAMGLLFVIGGVATVGCEDEASETDTDTAADTAPDEAGDTVLDTAVDPGPDTRPEVTHDVGCDSTLGEMIDMCVPDETWRNEINACLDALHGSWRTGLEEMLACESCYAVVYWLDDCLRNGMTDACDRPGEMGEFDVDAFIDSCSVPIYLGLRME